MRLEELSNISNDHFYVTTAEQITLQDFTRTIASQYKSFAGLPQSSPKKSPYTIDGNKISVIDIDGIIIEIEQLGCSLGSSNRFLINTQDKMSESRLKEFSDYLKRSMNGQAHQLYLF